MDSGYWARLKARRTSRRAALRAAGGLGLGAAAVGLVGCGGSDDGSGDAGGDLVYRPRDTSKSARAGGVFLDSVVNDASGFDPYLRAEISVGMVANRTYSRLLQFTPGVLGGTPAESIEGDLAESWELSDDKLTLTFKLRPNAKWDSRPPTNSRPVDAEDIVFSWKRFEAIHINRSGLANSVSKDAPIVTMEALDKQTVRVKMAVVLADVLMELARASSRFLILPREADGVFDPQKDVRGSSAWILAEYQPSVGFKFAKNPNWYRQDRPFVDRWELPILSEYAQRLAQFRAGRLYMPTLLGEDVVPTKKSLPDLLMIQGDWSDSVQPMIRFGIQDANSPFRDKRVRQAISMLIDRETIIRAFRGVDLYASEGIPVQTRWLTHGGVEAGLLVSDKEFGANAKYFQFMPEEARKLLGAAGYGNGFETDVIFSSTSSDLHPEFSAIVSQIEKGGIKTTTKVWDFNTQFNTNVRRGRGVKFNGMAFDPGSAFPLTSYLWRRLHSKGTVFPGFDPDGKDPARGDPKVDELTSKMIAEFEQRKRQELVNEFLRYMAEQMYEVPAGGQALGYQLAWPAVGNAGVFRAIVPAIERDVHLWLDTKQKPLA